MDFHLSNVYAFFLKADVFSELPAAMQPRNALFKMGAKSLSIQSQDNEEMDTESPFGQCLLELVDSMILIHSS